MTKYLFRKLNGEWNEVAMRLFTFIIFTHLLEHIFQMYQLYVLHWPRPQCLGLLGLYFPYLVHSEILHWGHALFMVLGLALLYPSITQPTARKWWKLTFVLAFLHHIEHFLLLEQAISHHYLFVGTLPTPSGKLGVPISLGQVIFPKLGIEILRNRIEIHMFYNLIVATPMTIALYFNKKPKAYENHI